MTEIKDCWLKNHCNHKDCNSNFCMRLFKLDNLYNNALVMIQNRQHIPLQIDEDSTDLEEFTKLNELSKGVISFIQNGESLFLHSNISGNGKTSWALRFIQNYFNSVWVQSDCSQCLALFINVPRFLLELKDNISIKSEYVQHIKDNIATANLVVWDDIGTKSITSFESENLLSLIDIRLNNGKSNIYTSNLNDEELYNYLGTRLASRLLGSTYNITLKGKDKRGIKR